MPVTTEELIGTGANGNHSHCVMCGDLNQLSLRLKFVPDESGNVAASFQGHSLLQGYDGILHGGVISALLDAAMTHCLFHRNIEAVTGQLFVRFLASVPYDARVTLRARLVEATPPLYQLQAELGDGCSVLARADAKFMQRTPANGIG